MSDRVRQNFKVSKVDSELGLVFGYAIVCKIGDKEYFDLQGDHIPEDVMLASSTEFMCSWRDALELHSGESKGTVVFGFPMTTEIAESLGIKIEKSGFLIGMKFYDDALIEKFRTGEYTGFSIGGVWSEAKEVASA